MLIGVGPKRKYQHQLPLIRRLGEEDWLEKEKDLQKKKTSLKNNNFGSV